MKIRILPLICGMVVASPGAANAEVPELVFALPDAAPQAFSGNELRHGIAGDACIEAAKRAGFLGRVEFPPWKRAQDDVSSGKDLLIAGLARIRERETRFTWIYPIMSMGRAFVTLDRGIESYAQAAAELRYILVGLGAAEYDVLRANGIPESQIRQVRFDAQEAGMMLAGRADGWFNTIPQARWFIKNHPETKDLVIGPALNVTEQYMACSRLCSPALVAALTDALASMKADGTLDRIVSAYE
ncbi:MAG TPA: transporter substrate-binding domain-containing protein [Aliidongia sp.]|uniref:substrate-binding periplasmic protein n=1 Tax=Aliidongia sp. TaxID=1914230 RepID=UPI002DDCBBDD|nr:transporter substrate-binding domain-containing protein [Aliidongia sp.]HEV2675884.1 transporter substrate-binding domain-containing protein [Aliidongia sp.]